MLDKYNKLYSAIANRSQKDWCTMFYDGDYGEECCKPHDEAYVDKSSSKFKTDIKLFKCIKRKKNIAYALVAFIGVSTFGWIWRNKALRGSWYKF